MQDKTKEDFKHMMEAEIGRLRANGAIPDRKPVTEDSFEDELYCLLQDVPWEVWKQMGYQNIRDVRVRFVEPDACYDDGMRGSVCLHIKADGSVHKYLNGFGRIDLPCRDLARHWKPYRDFIRKYLYETLEYLEQADRDAEDTVPAKMGKTDPLEAGNEASMWEKELEAKMTGLLETGELEYCVQLKHYINALGLRTWLWEACKKENPETMEGLRVFLLEQSCALMTLLACGDTERVLRECLPDEEDLSDKIRLIEKLQHYCMDARKTVDETPEDVLLRYLLYCPEDIDMLEQVAEETADLVRDHMSDGMRYIFDQTDFARVIRRDMLSMGTPWKHYQDQDFLIGFYHGFLYGGLHVFFKNVLGVPDMDKNLKKLTELAAPYLRADEEFMQTLSCGAKPYEAMCQKRFDDFEIKIHRIGNAGYIMEMPLFGKHESGSTESEAREKLQKRFTLYGEDWMLEYIVRTLFIDPDRAAS